MDEKPTVVPVGSVGEQSGGATRAPPRAFSASQDGQFLSHPQCGYLGCVDLRPWAKANRYRYRLEESYQAENNAHVKGDGRWFVEVLCQRGLIYPCRRLGLGGLYQVSPCVA